MQMTSGRITKKKHITVKRKQIEVQIVVVWKSFLMKNSPLRHALPFLVLSKYFMPSHKESNILTHPPGLTTIFHEFTCFLGRSVASFFIFFFIHRRPDTSFLSPGSALHVFSFSNTQINRNNGRVRNRLSAVKFIKL